MAKSDLKSRKGAHLWKYFIVLVNGVLVGFSFAIVGIATNQENTIGIARKIAVIVIGILIGVAWTTLLHLNIHRVLSLKGDREVRIADFELPLYKALILLLVVALSVRVLV